MSKSLESETFDESKQNISKNKENQSLIMKSESTPALPTGAPLVVTHSRTYSQPNGQTGIANELRYSSCHSSSSGVSSNSALSNINVFSTNSNKISNKLPLVTNQLIVNTNKEIKTNSNKKSLIRNKTNDKSTNSLTQSLKKLLKIDRKLNYN